MLKVYGRELLTESLDKALAVDGQVDAYQVTNKFVAVSIVTIDGFLQNKFISSEAPDGRGANGMLEAVKNGLGWNWTHAVKIVWGYNRW